MLEPVITTRTCSLTASLKGANTSSILGSVIVGIILSGTLLEVFFVPQLLLQ